MVAVNIPKEPALDQAQHAAAYLRRLQKTRVSEVFFDDAVSVYAAARSSIASSSAINWWLSWTNRRANHRFARRSWM